MRLGSLVLYQGKGVLYTEQKRYTARADRSMGVLTKENTRIPTNIAKMWKDLFLSLGVPVLCGNGILADVC